MVTVPGQEILPHIYNYNIGMKEKFPRVDAARRVWKPQLHWPIAD